MVRFTRPVKDFPSYTEEQLAKLIDKKREERFGQEGLVSSEEQNQIKFEVYSDQINNHDGFLSFFKSVGQDKALRKKIRMLICVTLYNEPRNQLDDTLNGVLNNIDKFAQAGISNEEIAVVVIFDGIEHLNNQQDDGIIKMFNEIDNDNLIFDSAIKMESQYNAYKKMVSQAKQKPPAPTAAEEQAALKKRKELQLKCEQKQLEKLQLLKQQNQAAKADLLQPGANNPMQRILEQPDE